MINAISDIGSKTPRMILSLISRPDEASLAVKEDDAFGRNKDDDAVDDNADDSFAWNKDDDVVDDNDGNDLKKVTET